MNCKGLRANNFNYSCQPTYWPRVGKVIPDLIDVCIPETTNIKHTKVQPCLYNTGGSMASKHMM